jgi:hypothetical protein
MIYRCTMLYFAYVSIHPWIFVFTCWSSLQILGSSAVRHIVGKCLLPYCELLLQSAGSFFCCTEAFKFCMFSFFFFFFFGFSRQGFSVLPWLSWNSRCRPGWPQTQKSACLCLRSAGIKGVRHHAQHTISFVMVTIIS